MNRYYVDSRDGRKPSYLVRNKLTGIAIASTFSDLLAANHVVMCLNLYEELKETKQLQNVLDKLNEE